MKTMPKPMNKKPWCWLDTETTGLSPFEDPKTRRAYDSSGPVSLGSRVIQVAVKVTSDSLGPWTRGGRREYSSNVKIPVDALAAAAPKALEVNGFAQVVATRNTARALGCYLAQPVGDRFAPGEEVTEAVLAEAESAYASLSEGSLKSMLHPIKEPAVWVMRDPARWFDAPPPEEVWPIVHSMLSGCHLVCQNVPFDRPHIQNEFKLLDLTYPADFRGIEVMSYSNLVAQRFGLTTWGLELVYNTMAERMNLPPIEAHRALGDVERMMVVYKFVREVMARAASQVQADWLQANSYASSGEFDAPSVAPAADGGE